MARTRSSSSSSKLRYCNPAYYLKRPKRLALLLILFVSATFFVWDRQTLVREHEVSSFFVYSLILGIAPFFFLSEKSGRMSIISFALIDHNFFLTRCEI